MAGKLLKRASLIPTLILLTGIIMINAGLYCYPETTVTPGDTVNADVIRELRGLKYALDNNADLEMQKLYPEGYLFINALYGLAWCNVLNRHPAPEYVCEGLAEIQKTWNKINGPLGRAPFDEGLPLPHGAFYAGWSTFLLGQKLVVQPAGTREENELIIFKQRCELIAAALKETVYPESYRGGVWPADVVVCAASLALHDKLFQRRYGDLIKAWILDVKSNLDVRGLIPHSVESDTGRPLEGACGSSMGLMLIFMKDIDQAFGEQQFLIYKSTFQDSFVGLPAVREYATNDHNVEDIDSGPVIFGMGSAATIVGMQTFDLYGHREHSIKIRNALEAIAFPTTSSGKKTYLFGLTPMADAFITWGHSAQNAGAHNKPSFLIFHLFSALAISLILMLLWLLWR